MAAESMEPEVRIATGTLRGRSQDGVAAFRGIPFAQPPVGALRFAAPRPVVPWDGVRPAAAFGPPPPQAGAMSMGGTNPPYTGEDWLTVNVWSPQPDTSARLPVMVWVYGGAYMFGAASEPLYDGALIAREGGVVMVTFNYRVGMEGFAQIEGAPANRGLLDQVAALEWVRDNITAFGGDPGHVTIFGESAGAGSIAALMTMPRAAGLFRRAIAQSVPGTLHSPELAADICRALAAHLGLRPTAADLAGVAPPQLPAAGDAVTARLSHYAERWGQQAAFNPTPFSPVVDGDVLPRSPWQALADGAGHDIELLAGHNRDEYRLFIAPMLGHITEDQATAALRALAPRPGGERAFRHAYPNASAEELFTLVTSDWLFRMPSLHLAEAHIAGGGRAHVYELTWTAPAMDGALGTPHGADLPLVFGRFDAPPGPGLLGGPPTPQTQALSARIRHAWAAFAHHGDPGWPAYDPSQRLVQILDTDPTVTPYPEEISRRLWEHHRFEALPLLG
ncbi:carboxylesterase/lipase family protein [Streptomyces jumonjinensis]|uniref:Carboxylic ester hydrolase n=1 Tax=Streptomyces jumonjinensis TaxID=1945 RepID=A0A646KS80_STRJU|nr:carboxylesterase family protein [Streptomyces jumonjinensis]MQT05113.1 carboxylesterase family protein [Streptomyces jumonjinensis]